MHSEHQISSVMTTESFKDVRALEEGSAKKAMSKYPRMDMDSNPICMRRTYNSLYALHWTKKDASHSASFDVLISHISSDIFVDDVNLIITAVSERTCATFIENLTEVCAQQNPRLSVQHQYKEEECFLLISFKEDQISGASMVDDSVQGYARLGRYMQLDVTKDKFVIPRVIIHNTQRALFGRLKGELTKGINSYYILNPNHCFSVRQMATMLYENAEY